MNEPKPYILKFCAEIGGRLQEEMPAIADDYRGGCTIRDVVVQNDIPDLYEISEKIAMSAVRYALRGAHTTWIEYEGLLTPEEAARLAEEHRAIGRLRLAEQGTGIYGLTSEDRRQLGLDLSARLGNTAWKEADSERGLASEIDYTLILAQHENYHRGSKVAVSKIAEELNIVYHGGEEIRSGSGVRAKLKKFKLSMGQQTCPRPRWSDEETAYLHRLARDDSYKLADGRLDKKSLADEVNERFENNRSPKAILAKLQTIDPNPEASIHLS